MTYQEVLEHAKNMVGPYCKSCPVCNGLACRNKMPGPGAKGLGTVFIRNYQKWQELCLNMDTIYESTPVDTRLHLFGKTLEIPVFAAPIGSLLRHYGDKMTDLDFYRELVPGCRAAGIAACTGDAKDPQVMAESVGLIGESDGMGIPTLTPWHIENHADILRQKMDLFHKTRPMAIAMAVDAAGLPFFSEIRPQSVEQLKRIVAMTDIPFIIKGVMTVSGAQKALQTGAAAIVVSNHGGRVLDQCPSTAEVLPAIADAVGGRMKILVDGGIRTGLDVFKALALGADGVLIGRPFVNMVYGAGTDGIQVYVDKLKSELTDAMTMCGANKLADINRSMLFGF